MVTPSPAELTVLISTQCPGTGSKGMTDHTENRPYAALKPWGSKLAICVLALALGLAQFWWLQRGQAQPVVALPATAIAKVPCLSYAPFRRDGANPVRVDADITPAQIEEDLRLIKNLSSCIRTYGVGKGLAAVPEIAARLGIRVRLGVWLGRDQGANHLEMETALALTHKFRSDIEALIVGNEVLLREDLSPQELGEHLKAAKARSAVPISYADVWEFWRRHASLKQYVDIITIHVLPYWEDEPVPAIHASAHVFSTLSAMQKEFDGQPVWLGETGWPAAGRQRAGAIPGVLEQTRVLREVILRAAQERVDVNLIEAFDQPWKRSLEGGMGATWGMFRADGTLRMSFQGPVQEDALWWRGNLAGLMAALFGTLWGVLSTRRKGPGMASNQPADWPQHQENQTDTHKRIGGYALTLGLIGTIAPAHWDAMALWSRDRNEWCVAILATALVAIGTISLLLELFGPHKRTLTLAQVKEMQISEIRARAAQVGMLLVASIWSWYLWVDPRYRGFPIALFFSPAALSICLLLKRKTQARHALDALVSSVLALGLACFAVMIMLNEGSANTQALIIGTLWLAMALRALQACYPRRSKAAS
jgi:exo-beta-1,3-glucanase (GH17 family)